MQASKNSQKQPKYQWQKVSKNGKNGQKWQKSPKVAKEQLGAVKSCEKCGQMWARMIKSSQKHSKVAKIKKKVAKSGQQCRNGLPQKQPKVPTSGQKLEGFFWLGRKWAKSQIPHPCLQQRCKPQLGKYPRSGKNPQAFPISGKLSHFQPLDPPTVIMSML